MKKFIFFIQNCKNINNKKTSIRERWLKNNDFEFDCARLYNNVYKCICIWMSHFIKGDPKSEVSVLSNPDLRIVKGLMHVVNVCCQNSLSKLLFGLITEINHPEIAGGA